MWAVAILLHDGRRLDYDVAAETERVARAQARDEMIAELGLQHEWQADALIRCILPGRL